MSGIDSWGMDIFKLSLVTNRRPLTAVAYTVFQVPYCQYLLRPCVTD